MLQPYMDLVSWDVHAVYELPYAATIEVLRQLDEAADHLAVTAHAGETG